MEGSWELSSSADICLLSALNRTHPIFPIAGEGSFHSPSWTIIFEGAGLSTSSVGSPRNFDCRTEKCFDICVQTHRKILSSHFSLHYSLT